MRGKGKQHPYTSSNHTQKWPWSIKHLTWAKRVPSNQYGLKTQSGMRVALEKMFCKPCRVLIVKDWISHHLRCPSNLKDDCFTSPMYFLYGSFKKSSPFSLDFSGSANGKEPTCQCKGHKIPGFSPQVGKILWRRKWQLAPVFLPGAWTEEPGGLQFIGLHRVRHNWSNWAQRDVMRPQNQMEFETIKILWSSLLTWVSWILFKFSFEHLCIYPDIGLPMWH